MWYGNVLCAKAAFTVQGTVKIPDNHSPIAQAQISIGGIKAISDAKGFFSKNK